MNRVQRLSGEGCSYFQQGRCTRTLDPDTSAASRCSLLEARREVGAKTLDRLERIKKLGDPDDREVARRLVVQKNLDAISRITCPDYETMTGSGSLCRYQHLIYCLLLMPACEGRCDHFLRRNSLEQKAPKDDEAS